MVHAIGFEEERAKERVEMLKGKDHFMEVLQIILLIYKTSLDLRSGFLIMFHQNFLRVGMIRFLILDPKWERKGTHKMRSLHVPSV